MNVLEKQAYVCSVCGSWYSEELVAERCCQPKHCEDCECELPANHQFTVCDHCREQRKLSKAEKISLKDYVARYPNAPLFTQEGEAIDIDQLDECGTQMPEYFYGAKNTYIALDAEYIINQLEEVVFDSDYQPFDDAAYKEIKDFCSKWNEEHKVGYFVENSELAVYVGGDEDAARD